MPDQYLARIDRRCARGVETSEAMRQFMDEAERKSLASVTVAITGHLNLVRLAAAKIELKVNRQDRETLSDLKQIELSLQTIMGILTAAAI